MHLEWRGLHHRVYNISIQWIMGVGWSVPTCFNTTTPTMFMCFSPYMAINTCKHQGHMWWFFFVFPHKVECFQQTWSIVTMWMDKESPVVYSKIRGLVRPRTKRSPRRLLWVEVLCGPYMVVFIGHQSRASISVGYGAKICNYNVTPQWHLWCYEMSCMEGFEWDFGYF